jgi:hypothetical protein
MTMELVPGKPGAGFHFDKGSGLNANFIQKKTGSRSCRSFSKGLFVDYQLSNDRNFSLNSELYDVLAASHIV